MGSNVDKYTTETEHALIDHTGIPGVGVGGTTVIVGTEIIEVDADIATAAATTKTIPANTLTVDLQSIEVRYAWNSGTGATPSLGVTFGGVSILSTGALTANNTEGSLVIWAVRTGATTARVTAIVTEDARDTEIIQSNSITLDWSISRDLVFTFTSGTDTVHRYYQALKFPESGSLGLSGIGSDTLPTGTIVPYSGTIASVPAGFLPCDGSLADQTVESELFAVIGTIWNTGGEPGGFFRLPDLRGRSVLGLNDGTLPAGIDGGLTTRTLATRSGSEFSVTAAENEANATADAGGTGIAVDDHTHNVSVMHPFAVCAYIIKSQQVGGGVGVTAQNNGGALTGTQPTLNFIPSGDAGIMVAEDVGNNRLDITISASSSFNSYETGGVTSGNLGSGAGSYSVGGSWAVGFSPHGLLITSGGTTDGFAAIGFCKANTGGVTNQGHVAWTGTPTVTSSSSNLAANGGSSIASDTPLSNSWTVTRTGSTGNAWNYAAMILGRGTS